MPGLAPVAGRASFPAPPAPVRPLPAPDRSIPPLDALVEVPAGTYRLGEPGEERAVAVGPVLIGRLRLGSTPRSSTTTPPPR
jgi:hypothetical protein